MAIVAQPFVKWAGGKRHLLSQLETLLPDNFDELEDVTYVEPFVGGGAVLFHMLNNHPNIRRAIINDINPNLIECYRLVKEHPNELISELQKIQDLYNSADIEGKERIYYDYRSKYNNDELTSVKKAAIFIFLNHTCFNGLYRVNANGAFNVPFGKYMKPMICNAELILEDSRLLNSVDLVIMNGDYRGVGRRLARRNTNFVYFDPPYRPISVTSSFHTYSNIPFGDVNELLRELNYEKIRAEKKLAKIFPKVEKWTSLITAVSVPLAFGSLWDKDMLTILGTAGFGLSQAIDKISSRLKDNYRWVGLLNKH